MNRSSGFLRAGYEATTADSLRNRIWLESTNVFSYRANPKVRCRGGSLFFLGELGSD